MSRNNKTPILVDNCTDYSNETLNIIEVSEFIKRN